MNGYPQGFTPRTHCPEGHDLATHGRITFGTRLCGTCKDAKLRGKFKGRPQLAWARAKKESKKGKASA